MFKQPTGGTYAITEQGDLGLGLTPVDEQALNNEKKEDKKKDEKQD